MIGPPPREDGKPAAAVEKKVEAEPPVDLIEDLLMPAEKVDVREVKGATARAVAQAARMNRKASGYEVLKDGRVVVNREWVEGKREVEG